MKKVFSIIAVFLVICMTAISVTSVVMVVNPHAREKIEMFLKIDDENAISTLKDKIKEQEEQINEYETRIEDLKANISDLEETTDKLQIEDKELKAEIERLKTRVQELESQVENLNGNIDELLEQIEEMNKEVDELWNIFNNLNKYENALNNGTSAETELTESEKELLEEKIENLEETVSDLTNEIEDLNETISDLNNQIENLESQKIKIQNDKIINDNIINDRSTNIDELNVTINNYYKEIENIDKSIENNNTIINNLINKQENGDGLSDKEIKQLNDLRGENESLISQKYDINANLTECENRVAVLQSEVEILVKNNENYSKQITSLDEQITTLENEISILENETINVQSNINSLQDKINKFNGLIGNSTIKNENGDVVQEPSNPINPDDEKIDCEHIAGNSVQENYKETDTEISYDLVTYCTKCGEQISRETVTETRKPEHTCTVSHYNIENEVTLEDGSKQYDKVGYCECGLEVSRESIVEEKEVVIYENYIVDATSTTGTEYKINFEEGMTWENWLNSNYNTIGLITEDNYIYSADKTLVLRLNLTDNILVSETIISDDTYKLYAVEKHTCTVSHYNIENEITLEDGSKQYDKVGYCTCGTEISRETIIEKAETKTVFSIFGTEYEYEDGMNWNDYCSSTKYNPNGYYVENDKVYWVTPDGYKNLLCDSSYKVISASDKIQSTSYTWMGA